MFIDLLRETFLSKLVDIGKAISCNIYDDSVLLLSRLLRKRTNKTILLKKSLIKMRPNPMKRFQNTILMHAFTHLP